MQRHGRNLARADVRCARRGEAAADTASGGGVLQIEPAAKSAAFAGQDNCANVRIVVEVLERFIERTKHLGADRVHAIGPIEFQYSDLILFLDE